MEHIKQLPFFNDIISFVDNVMPHIDTVAEAKILIFISEYARFTPTYIPVNEFVKGTGLSKASVLRGLQSAQRHGLINVIVDEAEGSTKNYYCLRQTNEPVSLSVAPRKKEPKLTQASQPKEGYVYLLQSISGHYKIGRTRNPENRIKTFGIQLPFEVEYVCLIKTTNMVELENALHMRFSSKRINGEWFNLDTEDVAYLRELAT